MCTRWICRASLVAVALCGIGVVRLRAADPVDDPNDLAQYDRVIDASDREHWAFQPIARPKIPAVKNAGWTANPIDNSILARLEAKGWKPNPPAEPRQLLRRISLDVVGLPPSPDEQRRFLADDAPDAWEQWVDRLLADPGYGERWARHWLDLVRYAETNGYERDAAKPQVWKYRDWVIDALNADLPYDRFALEQIAGDELPDARFETVIATGFHRLGPWDDEPADPEEDRVDQLDDMVRTTSQVFLGLTLGCARCHNHKFDALTAHDYYRMVAIFDPLKRPQNGRTELDHPAGSPAELAAVADRDRRIAAIKQPPRETKQQVAALTASVPDMPRGYFFIEPSTAPPPTHLLLRGRATSPGPRVEPGVPAVLTLKQPTFPKPGRRTSGRRLTFARWLVDARNPLTARVIVNRVWQYHFGQGLVRTASDFGVMGIAPTHPELLDWLAHWFVHDAHWSLKKLHRLVLTSSTYRMSKRIRPEYADADPENERFWRFPYRRLEVEAIRDSMLDASGQLRRTMHGPGVYLAVPKEALESHADKESIWQPFSESESARRTVYAFVKRSLVVPMLEVLDLCDTTRSSEKRAVTSVPTQALTLLNGDEVNRQSRRLADRLRREAGTDPLPQIDRAFALVLCRPPSRDETADLQTYLADESRSTFEEARASGRALTPAAARDEALVRLCRALFNLNEFAYPD